MGFDSVIADEGHNYRNSLKMVAKRHSWPICPPARWRNGARYGNQKRVLDEKEWRARTVLLTATPVVNTPIDAYNMLFMFCRRNTGRRWGSTVLMTSKILRQDQAGNGTENQRRS